MANCNIIFSPTGGTKKVSDILKKGIGGSWTDFELCVPEGKLPCPDLSGDDVCMICAPSFGGRVPEIMVERLRKVKGNGARAILVCVYGNREFEDTLTELQDEAEKQGFECIAAVSAVAEHSIVREIAKGRPDANDENVLLDFAEKIKEKISSGKVGIEAAMPGSHNTYKERGASAAKPVADDKCIACGICAEECPADAVSISNPKETDNEKCISCMKCIAVCPQKARALNPAVVATVAERLSKVCAERKENKLFI